MKRIKLKNIKENDFILAYFQGKFPTAVKMTTIFHVDSPKILNYQEIYYSFIMQKTFYGNIYRVTDHLSDFVASGILLDETDKLELFRLSEEERLSLIAEFI